jgi:hypothetical protein
MKHTDYDIIGTPPLPRAPDPLPLFAAAPPIARASDPDTSHEAASALTSRAQQVTAVVRAAWAAGRVRGVTADEAARGSGLLAHSAGKRLSDAVALGYLADTAETRVGASGRQQTVRVITDAGVAYLTTPQGAK